MKILWLVFLLAIPSCRTVVQKPLTEEARNRNDPPRIKPMPNWVKQYDHDKAPWPRWV